MAKQKRKAPRAKHLTVGGLKKFIADLPDDMEVLTLDTRRTACWLYGGAVIISDPDVMQNWEEDAEEAAHYVDGVWDGVENALVVENSRRK